MSEPMCWPEQEAYNSWVKKHGVSVSREAGEELKRVMSDIRIAAIEAAREEGRAEGRKEERAAVVEWKRGLAVGYFNRGSFDLADMERHQAMLIERGEHREGESDG